MQTNAGLLLWAAQKVQGSNFCMGLDPHFGVMGLDGEFYSQFVGSDAHSTIVADFFGAVYDSMWASVILHNSGNRI